MLGIKDRTVVITGGTSGIGKATAKEFAILYAKIVIAARNQQRGDKTLNELKKITDNCIFVKTDISDYRQVENLISRASSRFGTIDFMINNAANFTGVGDSVVELKAEDWKTKTEVRKAENWDLGRRYWLSFFVIRSLKKMEYMKPVSGNRCSVIGNR